MTTAYEQSMFGAPSPYPSCPVEKVSLNMSDSIREEYINDKKVLVTADPVDPISIARSIVRSRKGNDEAFLIYNMDAVYDSYQLWKRELPNVQPFYAVKCNYDEVLLRTMAALGAGFDCASRGEIDTVLRMGVASDRIIFAHAIKPSSHVAHASRVGVALMTFDNEEELEKIAANHTNPQLLLRISTSDPTAKHVLSLKFGAHHEQEAPQLLKRAAEMGLPVVGISFHVGSGCNDSSAYRLAIQHTRQLFDFGRTLGHMIDLVDIGGGFPGNDLHPTSFKQIAAVLRSAIDEYFTESNIRFVAEPGRFFAERVCTEVVTIIARTSVSADKITQNSEDASSSGFMYYINDGIYGNFNSRPSRPDLQHGRPLFNEDGKEEGDIYPSIIWGPTCDCADKIEGKKMMRALNVGDCLFYEGMGAYTASTSTQFNGFPRPSKISVMSERTWNALGFEHNNNNLSSIDLPLTNIRYKMNTL